MPIFSGLCHRNPTEKARISKTFLRESLYSTKYGSEWFWRQLSQVVWVRFCCPRARKTNRLNTILLNRLHMKNDWIVQRNLLLTRLTPSCRHVRVDDALARPSWKLASRDPAEPGPASALVDLIRWRSILQGKHSQHNVLSISPTKKPDKIYIDIYTKLQAIFRVLAVWGFLFIFLGYLGPKWVETKAET